MITLNKTTCDNKVDLISLAHLHSGNLPAPHENMPLTTALLHTSPEEKRKQSEKCLDSYFTNVKGSGCCEISPVLCASSYTVLPAHRQKSEADWGGRPL